MISYIFTNKNKMDIIKNNIWERFHKEKTYKLYICKWKYKYIKKQSKIKYGNDYIIRGRILWITEKQHRRYMTISVKKKILFPQKEGDRPCSSGHFPDCELHYLHDLYRWILRGRELHQRFCKLRCIHGTCDGFLHYISLCVFAVPATPRDHIQWICRVYSAGI